MKIVLIQPLVKDLYDKSYGYKLEPLGLGYIGAYLKDKGYEDVNIIVCKDESDDKKILDLAQDADIVGITATSTMMHHGKIIAKKIKGIKPETIVIFGGAYPTTMVDNTLEDPNIDIVVKGEGEVTFFEFVKSLDGKEDYEHIDGTSFKRKNKILHNKDRQLIEDLDSLPFPLREEINQNDFLFSTKYTPSVHMISSRGCPFLCTFCASNRIWTRRYRTRSAENLIQEMKELADSYPIKHINFADDTFTVNRERVKQFCSLIKREKIQLTWSCNVHVNTIDLDLLIAMTNAGCIEIWIGVESGSPTILKNLNKKVSLERIKKCFEWGKFSGLKRHAYLVVGSPLETSQTLKETVNLMDEIKPDSLSICIFTPFPGSPYFEEAKKNNYFDINIDWTKINLLYDSIIPTLEFSTKEVPRLRKQLLRALEQYNPEKHPLDD